MNIDKLIDRLPYKRFVINGAAVTGVVKAVAPAVVSGVAQGSMNRATRKFNREEAEKQRAWNEEMWNKTNAWNEEMWNKENEYNSPISQVQRMRDAGLNPLFYGLDGSSAGDLTAGQPLGYDRAQAGDQINPISAGIDAAIKTAQVANIQADTAKKNNENLTETQRREKLQAEIEETRQQINNLKAQEGLTNSQKEKLDKDIAWLDRMNEAVIAEKEANAKLSESQRNRIDQLLEGEKILQVKNIEDFDYKWSKIKAEIAKMAKETGLLAKDIENYALNHANNGFMGTGLSIPNLIRLGHESGKPKAGEENKFSESGNDWQDIARSGQ